MPLGVYLGDEEPFDPRINLGVEPLASVEATRPPVTPRNPGVAQPPASSDNGDETREFLARVLLSLGSIGGEKAPAFLTQALNQRAVDRRQDKSLKAYQERQLASQEAIAARQERAAGLKSESEGAKSERMGGAAADVNETIVRSGIEAIDGSMMMQLENHLIRKGGWDPKQAREYVTAGIGRKWEQSKDGKTMIVTFNNGMPPKQFPLDTIQEVGKTIVQMRGTTPGASFMPPERITKGAEQSVEQLPGQMIPGPGALPVAPGTIQPTGGLEGTGPQTLIPAREKEQQLSSEQRGLLTGTKFSGARTFEELERAGGGQEFQRLQKAQEDQKRQAAADEADRRAQAMTMEIERREGARAAREAESKETQPVNERITYWWDPKTRTRATNANLSPRELKEAGYVVVKDPRVSQSLESMNKTVQDLQTAWGVATRHPVWFPRSRGVGADQVLTYAGARARSADMGGDSSTFAALVGNLAGYARAAGDTRISNMDIELQKMATGLGPAGFLYGGGMTLEGLQAKLNLVIQRYNEVARTNGFEPVPLLKLPGDSEGIPLPGGVKSNRRSFGVPPKG